MPQQIDARSDRATSSPSRYDQIIQTLLLIFIAIFLALSGTAMLVFAEVIPTEYGYGRKMVQTFGSFMLVGATTSLIYRFVFRPAVERKAFERMRNLFRLELTRLVPKVFFFGLMNIETRPNFAELFDSLREGDEFLWLDTYAPGHLAWVRNLQDALKRGATIKMLVLDPRSQSAEFRAKEIQSQFITADEFQAQLRTFYDHMVRCAEGQQHRMEVRVYADLLGCPIYLIARHGRAVRALTSLYLGPATFDFPHFVWEDAPNRDLLDSFEKYFRTKWKESKIPSLKGAGATIIEVHPRMSAGRGGRPQPLATPLLSG